VQVMYVAEFDVEPDGAAPAGAYDALTEHICQWLGGDQQGAPSPEDLLSRGRARLVTEVPGAPRPSERDVAWNVEDADSQRALRVDVRQPLGPSGAEFVTRVTLSRDGEAAALRVAMGREVSTGWLSPAVVNELHRPRLVLSVARDPALRVTVLGQRVDGRYAQLRDAASVAVLAEAIAQPVRLPVILAHPRSDAAWAVVRRASSGLVGLASVAAINYTAAQQLARADRGLAVPDGGARLIWPDPSADHPRYSRAEIEGRGEEGMRALWMGLLSELSVVARGQDRGWDRARRAAQRAQAAAAQARLERAAEGDSAEQASALRARVDELTGEVAFWEEEAQRLTVDTDGLRARAESLENARRERDYWRDQYQQSVRAPAPDEAADTDPWEMVPCLEASAGEPTYRALEKAAEGRIAFAASAETSWKSSGYPHRQEMTDVLLALSKAAIDLYAHEGQMPRLTEWFKIEHGLTVAMSDQRIKKSKAMRYFDHDGEQWDGLPHVKVRDAVSPNEVGRVHFALDSTGMRIVVGHVGLKLHGV